MNFYLKHEFFLMYFKIHYDFTIRVCFAFSVLCQNHDFNNLARVNMLNLDHETEIIQYKKKYEAQLILMMKLKNRSIKKKTQYNLD